MRHAGAHPPEPLSGVFSFYDILLNPVCSRRPWGKRGPVLQAVPGGARLAAPAAPRACSAGREQARGDARGGGCCAGAGCASPDTGGSLSSSSLCSSSLSGSFQLRLRPRPMCASSTLARLHSLLSAASETSPVAADAQAHEARASWRGKRLLYSGGPQGRQKQAGRQAGRLQQTAPLPQAGLPSSAGPGRHRTQPATRLKQTPGPPSPSLPWPRWPPRRRPSSCLSSCPSSWGAGRGWEGCRHTAPMWRARPAPPQASARGTAASHSKQEEASNTARAWARM